MSRSRQDTSNLKMLCTLRGEHKFVDGQNCVCGESFLVHCMIELGERTRVTMEDMWQVAQGLGAIFRQDEANRTAAMRILNSRK